MNVKQFSAIIILMFFLIISVSSVNAADLGNSTDSIAQYPHDDLISEDGNSDENINSDYYFEIPNWSLDENGNIVIASTQIVPVKKPKIANISGDNGTDLRNGCNQSVLANFSDIINQIQGSSQMPSPVSMIILNRNDCWVDNQHDFVPESVTINLDDYINNSCSVTSSKSFTEFIDFVKENSVKPNVIESKDVNMFYSKNNVYGVRILNPVGDSVGKDVNVTFIFNGKKITTKTDDMGYARLKVNSQPGTYAVKIYSGKINATGKIVIKPLFKTKNVIVKYKKSSKFTVELVKRNGKPISKQTVDINFNGKNYKVKTNSKGIATFNIPKNLKIKKYKIKTTYNGCIVTNRITVKK